MNRAESIRHNARLILQHVRGKSKAERRGIYDMLTAGPLGLMLHAISAIITAQKPMTINAGEFGGAHEDVIRSIERGARAATAKRFEIRG